MAKLELIKPKFLTDHPNEVLAKEVRDNLVLTIEMMDVWIKEIDNHTGMSIGSKIEAYGVIMDALEGNIEAALRGEEAFLERYDMSPEDFYFFKYGEHVLKDE